MKLECQRLPLEEMQLIFGLLVIIGEYTKDGNHVIFGRKLSAEYNHGYKFLASLEDSEEDLIGFTINNKVFMLEDDEFLHEPCLAHLPCPLENKGLASCRVFPFKKLFQCKSLHILNIISQKAKHTEK